MTKKPFLFTNKREGESIEEFKERVEDELEQKEWVNEDGTIDKDKLAEVLADRD